MDRDRRHVGSCINLINKINAVWLLTTPKSFTQVIVNGRQFVFYLLCFNKLVGVTYLMENTSGNVNYENPQKNSSVKFVFFFTLQ